MDVMKKAVAALVLALLLTSCAPPAVEGRQTVTPIFFSTATELPTEQPVVEEEQAIAEAKESPEEGVAQEAKQGPDCLGPEVNEIGQAIADTYDESSYEEVMIWFCNGAEFEDILLALQSQRQSDNSAEEMLQMLDDGFNWDEIWQLVGIIE